MSRKLFAIASVILTSLTFVPTAYTIAAGASGGIVWPLPLPVAVVLAVSIEVIGVLALSLWSTFRSYNAGKLMTHPVAPIGYVYAAVTVYFVSVVSMTVVLHVFPSLATIAPAMLPFLSVVAAGLMALQSDHATRVAKIATERAERKTKRNKKKLECNSVAAKSLDQQPWLRPGLSKAQQIELYRQLNPVAGATEAAKVAGCSHQYASRVLAGSSNGNGHKSELQN